MPMTTTEKPVNKTRKLFHTRMVRPPLFFVIMILALSMPYFARTAPVIQEFVTDRGMTVLFAESHSNPMVVAHLLIRAGSAHDPEEREGLAELTARMLTEGVGNLSSEALHERLDYHGIRLSASAGRDALQITLTTLTEHMEEAWSLLADVVQQPRFDAVSFQRVRDEQIAEIIKDREDPSVRASQALYQLIYGRHPYAHPIIGTEQSLWRIRVTELENYHQDRFRASEMVLAVAGDSDIQRLKLLTEKYFTGAETSVAHSGAISRSPLIPATPTPGETKQITMDLAQSTFRLGRVGLNRKDPDYYPAYIMNYILGGGGFISRLNDEIREKRGLAYSVFSYFLPYSERGPLVVGLKTKSESMEEARRLVENEISRMARHGVTEKELNDAKRYLTGSFPLRFDGVGKIVRHLGVIGFYQLERDYLTRWPQRIRAVTLEDVARVARRFLSDKNAFHSVVVGVETKKMKKL